MQILHNHVGYRPDAWKFMILQADRAFPSADELTAELLEAGSDQVISRFSPSWTGGVPGWKGRYFCRFDFSQVTDPGTYRFRIETGGRTLYGNPFTISEEAADELMVSNLLFYLKGQRSSGSWDEVDRSIPFFGDRDGCVDVHGGWFDAAGDYSKYLSHLSYANFLNPQQIPLTVWALVQTGETLKGIPVHADTLLADRLFEEAWWGADFLMRMQDPEGFFYMTVFDKWSKDHHERMISTFRTKQGIRMENYQAGFRQGGGMAIAALARVSTHERDRIPADGFTPSQCLAAAERGYRHLVEHNSAYLDNGRENIIDCYCALTAAVELLKATEHDWYLEEARRWAGRLSSLFDPSLPGWLVEEGSSRPFYHASDSGLPILSLLLYTRIEPEEQRRKKTANLVLDVLKTELERAAVDGNPFMHTRQPVQAARGGEVRTSFFVPHDNESGYWWQGENARLASMAAMMRIAASSEELQGLAGASEGIIDCLRQAADAQLDWILGCNPFDTCMFQGYGRNNPRYEKHYPNAPGGICNGITGGFEDEEDIDFLPAAAAGMGDHRWRWSEQWIPHASWFMLALAAELGQIPLG